MSWTRINFAFFCSFADGEASTKLWSNFVQGESCLNVVKSQWIFTITSWNQKLTNIYFVCLKNLWTRFFLGFFLDWVLYSSQLHQCNTLTGCAHKKHVCHISFPFYATSCDNCVKKVILLSCDLKYGSKTTGGIWKVTHPIHLILFITPILSSI